MAGVLKIVIGGGCRCGKTTLSERVAKRFGLELYHSDDMIGLGWSNASDAFAQLIVSKASGVFEGVACTRALRKLMAATDGRPCDVYVHMIEPHVALSRGQLAMNKGVDTVFEEIRAELTNRGVMVRNACDLV